MILPHAMPGIVQRLYPLWALAASRRPAVIPDQLFPDDAVQAGRGRRSCDGSATASSVGVVSTRMADGSGGWVSSSHGEWMRLLRQSGFEVEDLKRPALL